MKRNIRVYLSDIYNNMHRALEYVGEMDFNAFLNDGKTNYAVIRCLEIIGEASKNIPDSVRDDYPDIPWKKMAGMRDKIIHEYFGVQLKIVWRVIKEDFPVLIDKVKKVSEITPEEI